MLRIGELARAGGVSVKALRFYDEIGLLVPEEIDGASRYRRYAPGQIGRLRRIMALKDLGLSLPAIGRILEEPESFGDRLREHRQRLTLEAASANERIARLDALLAGGAPDVTINVIVRDLPAAHGAAMRERLRRYEDLADLLCLGARYLPRQAGPLRRAALWHRCDTGEIDGEIDGEALFLSERPLQTSGPLRPIVLPRQRVASAVYAGEEWAPSYRAIAAWMTANGFEPAGPKREEFMTGDIVEVLVPIRRLARPAA
jgi:DNA-binding transcriptional MerR regulator